MEDFKVGDIVVLKSGGPDMTVADVKDQRVFCKWFFKGKYAEQVFKKELLKEADKPEDPQAYIDAMKKGL